MGATKATIYRANLSASKFCLNIAEGVLAIPDCEPKGHINYYQKIPLHFVILQSLGEENYICSCDTDTLGNCIHISEGK